MITAENQSTKRDAPAREIQNHQYNVLAVIVVSKVDYDDEFYKHQWQKWG